jgi:hypothetical protein
MGRSCNDQIFTLRQILEQSDEWNCPLYTNFIDFSKDFDSVHRPAIWKIFAHYGIPNKIIFIIKMLLTEFQANVICGTNLIDTSKYRPKLNKDVYSLQSSSTFV